MHFNEIFYSVFWISAVGVVWFYTDWFIHYTQLLNVAKKTRIKYTRYIIENPKSYFPNYLCSLCENVNNPWLKFVTKMSCCEFCLLWWLSTFAGLWHANLLIIAPVYIISLIIVLQIKRWIYTH